MSFHAQPNIDVLARLQAEKRKSTIASLLIAILAIVLVGLALAFIFIQPFFTSSDPIVTYQGQPMAEEKPDPKEVPTSQQRRPSAPSSAATRVITANAPSLTAIPVPEVDIPVESLEFGAGDDFGAGWNGSGSGAAGGGSGTMFGKLSGPGLKGSFYDLKQDRSGKPTEMRIQDFEKDGTLIINDPVNRTYDDHLRTIVRRNLTDQAFSDYFKAPKQLVLTQLYIPRVGAEEAPEAFELGEEVQGRRWVISYEGTIVAPERGRFRFVGFSDDILIVMENNRVVMDGSLAPTFEDAGDREFIDQEHTLGGWHSYVGKWMNVRKGEELDLKIMTGERPGGHYSGYLLIEKQGEDYQKDAGGAPILPLFKTESSADPERGNTLPALAPETPWSVWRTKS
ncbi:hypothetical protein [Roseibacillus ishigakijimensis]|uniref:PA14 domain-containing protein n=1 Tax=Roseibacillus ishigakijimensis TaxID=454146 RepID=A0A934VL93_9BACT|nr:hypothetical protein [Roseibacillus ishigakijimensis]MBK1832640.1 hypothetical protein [Roseibacillus ishigakijimensis]